MSSSLGSPEKPLILDQSYSSFEKPGEQQPELAGDSLQHMTNIRLCIQLCIQQSITISNLAVKSISQWSQKRNSQ